MDLRLFFQAHVGALALLLHSRKVIQSRAGYARGSGERRLIVAPRARFELATLRLTAECSTVELPGNGPSYEFDYKRLSDFRANLLSCQFGSNWFEQRNLIAIATAVLVILVANDRLELGHFAHVVDCHFAM